MSISDYDMKINKALMLFFCFFQSQPQNKHTREESPSETSGETITSQDSGRGSEEDFNGHNGGFAYLLNK